MRRSDRARFATGLAVLATATSLLLAAFAAPAASADTCPETERTVRFGFYAYFEPVSHSAGQDPAAPGFDEHRGYEADLLTALEAMEGINLSFLRRGVAAWENIWLLPAGPNYDMAGGGITVLDTRTRDAAGKHAVVFTAGHIRFRQSLLVRAEDARRLSRYQDLEGAVRVGVIAGTTGETRLLELAGLADANGVLSPGVRIDTPRGTAVADVGAGYQIAASGASPALDGRLRLHPPTPTMPQVIYVTDEAALIGALLAGRIDAVARGEIGNRHTARAYGGAVAVGAVDERAETGGFAVAAGDTALAACLNEAIGWLTDGGRIGYRDWLNDPGVFLRRARKWKA
ncbi:MAG: transporter substrate-binding domain-containing protein [Rhodospirillales bacterium]|nr:transporter substrate-binding domain-containing protein [Rhodospirillales bacterium]